ncbi:MAG: hypothetical protein R2873_27845 [Caldilineaceae bacterium]
MAPLTRKEFYDLAKRCREEALELARHDQNQVNLAQCRRYNEWLIELKGYDQLSPQLKTLRAARPINRWMVMGGAFGISLLTAVLLGGQLGANGMRLLSLGITATLILLYFLPESLYGTTVEMLEGRVLRVVETLEKLLFSRQMALTEAAFFQVKDNLETARRELRQQIHLAHK